MSTLTQRYNPTRVPISFVRKRDEFIEKLIPRRCMVVSVGMIFAGMGIYASMAFKLLAVTSFLGLAGLGLVAVGGALALIYCGTL